MCLSGSAALAETRWLFAQLVVWDKSSMDICEPVRAAVAV